MPIATGVMLLTNVGLAIFNNWRGTNNSKELQQKQREFQKAAQERNHERMKQLLREGQELNRKIEEELHQNRLENIERDFDSLINRIFAADDINTWPLKVLPMVMKNESLGSAFAHQEESVALHCILTPSNNSDFNKFVFPQLEREVEAFCNSNLTSLSSHPVIFYGGAWKSGTAPRGHEIDQLVADLPNLPMLLITPFFKPNKGGLAFHITTWGICERQFMEIVPTTQFDYDYTEDLEFTDDVVFNSVEQFSSYLESLIGYFADVYFWSSYNQVPITPLMVKSGIIMTDGFESLIQENTSRYTNLYQTSSVSEFDSIINNHLTLSLLSGISPFQSEEDFETQLEREILKYFACVTNQNISDCSFEQALSYKNYSNSDLLFFQTCADVCKVPEIKQAIRQITVHVKEFSSKKEHEILDSCDIAKLLDLANKGESNAEYRLFEIYEFSLINEYNPELASMYLNKAISHNNKFALLYNLFFGGGFESNDNAMFLVQSLSPDDNVQSAIYKSAALYGGKGCKQSIDESMNILEQYSESSHPLITYFASQIVKEQYGKEQSDLIIELLKKSAALGYVKAQVDLMNIFFEGELIAKDLDSCIKYAREASVQGHPEALFSLGYLFFIGAGTKKDTNKAKYFLGLAANRGNEDAIKLLKKL